MWFLLATTASQINLWSTRGQTHFDNFLFLDSLKTILQNSVSMETKRYLVTVAQYLHKGLNKLIWSISCSAPLPLKKITDI